MPLIPTYRRQRQVDLFEFKASLVYKVSSRTANAITQRSPVSKEKESYSDYVWKNRVGTFPKMKQRFGRCKREPSILNWLTFSFPHYPLHLFHARNRTEVCTSQRLKDEGGDNGLLVPTLQNSK